jgi:hypothetical protein
MSAYDYLLSVGANYQPEKFCDKNCSDEYDKVVTNKLKEQ